MIDELTKTEKLSGDLFVDGEDLGECRYELRYNPYSTNEMQLELFDHPGIDVSKMFKDFEVVTRFPWGSYKASGKLSGGTAISMKGQVARGAVKEFVKEQRFRSDGVPTTGSVGYLFPLTSVTDGGDFTIRHPSLGFVRGGWDDSDGAFLTPEIKTLRVRTEAGDFELTDEFDYHSRPSTLYGHGIFFRRSVASTKLDIENGDFESSVQKVQQAAEGLFLAISLVERNRINWHTERLIINDQENNPLLDRTTYRWVSPPTKGYKPNINVARQRRETLHTVCDKLARLSTSDAAKTYKTIRNFIVANVVPLLELQHIHWHSCLDFYKSEKEHDGKKFSKALVDMFDDAGVPIDDIVPVEEVEAVRAASDSKAPAFEFTKLRNAHIHDGFNAFEGREKEAIEHTRIMRALGERLLLQDLGIDFSETSLGQASFQ